MGSDRDGVEPRPGAVIQETVIGRMRGYEPAVLGILRDNACIIGLWVLATPAVLRRRAGIRLLVSTLALAALVAYYDPANPLPDGVRDAVGDYDLAFVVTPAGDTLSADRARVTLHATGADCDTVNADGLVRLVGVDGLLILSAVERGVSVSTTVYGTRCNDSTFVQPSILSGTYVLQERYLTLSLAPAGAFATASQLGTVDRGNDEIAFAFPGAGLTLVSVNPFGSPAQVIAAQEIVWRRAPD